MAWILVVDDTFARADTSTGAAGSTTGVGNGWIDVNGGVGQISSNRLQITPDGGGSPYARDFILRPSAENIQDQRVVVTVAATGNVNGQSGIFSVLRYNPGGGTPTAYLSNLSLNGTNLNFAFYAIAGASANQIDSGSGFSVPSGHQISVDISAVGINPTTISVIVTDITTNNVIHTESFSDSTAALQTPGQMGVAAAGQITSGFSDYFSGIATYAPGSSASDFTLTPSTQSTSVGTPTGNYTVTLNAPLSGSSLYETFVLVDGGAGGTFTPSSLVMSIGGTSSETFTYTPARTGTQTLTISSSGDFTASHTAACITSGALQALPITNTNLRFSPGNWDHLTTGTFGVALDTMQTTATGAVLGIAVTGTVNLSIGLDTSQLAGLSSSNMPIVSYSIDNGAFVDNQLTSGQTVLAISTNLTTGAHIVQVVVREFFPFTGDREGSSGVSPTNAVRINDVTLDVGGSLTVYPTRENNGLIFGDSIVETYNAIGNNLEDGTAGLGAIIGQALNANVGIVGYTSQGWEIAGAANMAPFKTAYAYFSVGRPRSLTGFSWIAVVHGTNDSINSVSAAMVQADAQAWIAAVRTAAGGGTVIFLVVPPGGFYAANLATAVATYKAVNPGDTAVYCIDISDRIPTVPFNGTMSTSGEYNSDNHHPNLFGHAVIGSAIAVKMQAAMAPTSPGAGSRSSVANA